MASVYEKCGRWYLRYKDERGRWTARASSAQSKTEARRLAEDFERKAERIRLGLEPAMVATGDRTVGDIVSWWLENVWIGRPSYSKAKSAISAHILVAPFASKRPQDVTSAEIEHCHSPGGWGHVSPGPWGQVTGIEGPGIEMPQIGVRVEGGGPRQGRRGR
ncbi:MAG TPA: hypothetical protein VMT03_16135, partial [Polyangia bacterium]|nr:hypothetical protein [Polyangia bacterium]